MLVCMLQRLHVHYENIIHNHMIKWGPSIVANDVRFMILTFALNESMTSKDVQR
jgi:hypothetical protein